MKTEEIKDELLGGRADIEALAAALGCTTRTIYATSERLRVRL